MLRYRMLLISGSYSKKDDGVTIELFGRLEDGRSATLLVNGFEPYFYIVEPREEDLERLKDDPMVIRTEERILWYRGKDRRCQKVTIVYPFEVPKYRKRLQERGYDILAADIPFIFRYLYDKDLGAYIEVDGEEVETGSYSTDIILHVGFIGPAEPFRCRLKVLSFDIENSIRSGELYMAGISVGWFPLGEGEELENSSIVPPLDMDDPREREDHVIEGLEKAVHDHDPDIITGYNIDGYDIPQILKRAQILSVEGMRMGRDGSFIDNMGYRSWRAKGRIVVDAWWQAKRTFRPKKETLESVSMMLLNEGKDDIDTSIIEKEWKERREEVVKYCIKDAELALRILDRTMSIKKGMEMALVAKLPLMDTLSGTTSNLIDSILIREADLKDIGIPLTKHEKKTSKIEGAYVHSIQPGLYHMLVVLDFRSMYPSLMIEKNICFTTLTESEEGTIPSPFPGVNYLPRSVRRGLVPEILERLMKERQTAKNTMKDSDDSDEREFYNGLQEALKILMNSFYGVFASFFYRFTDRKIGSSITAYARNSIRGIIDTLEGEGFDVIYSDTDSIFIRSTDMDLGNTRELGEKLASRFSSGAQVLEFEKVFDSFFTHGKKKRYVGRVVWPSEEMVVRGYEMRRTDSFDLQSKVLEEMFDMILGDRVDEALEHAKMTIKRVKEGEIQIQDLVISRSVQEVEEEKIAQKYKNPDSMANVQALRKTKRLGIETVPGMKVSWIVTDAKAKPQRVEPYIDGRNFEHEPDLSYYSERLSSTLSRITEVFDISEKELLTGVQQSSLFDSFSEADDPEGGANDVEEEGRISSEATENYVDEKKEEGDGINSSLDDWM